MGFLFIKTHVWIILLRISVGLDCLKHPKFDKNRKIFRLGIVFSNEIGYNIITKKLLILYQIGEKMNKTEFIKALANQANLSIKDASAAVDGFIEVVAEALKEGDKVAISGLGTFELKEKAARKGINPLTKEEIMIPASKSPSLKVGRLFKDRFN